MRRTAVLVLASFLISARAFAFESFCRKDPGLADWQAALDASICDLEGPLCAQGLESTRHRFLGEHVYIARAAMLAAGFSQSFVEDPTVLSYFGTGRPVPEDPTFTSMEPGGPGTMLRRIDRPLTLPEFSQVADFSHGLSDFLLGNEHCPLPNFVSNADCHTFEKHMGAVNSTHFVPQARAAFEIYHRIALDTASRCKATLDAFGDGEARPLANKVNVEIVPACEKEALAIEAVAQHFLGDAWAAGHMWQRWGSPLLEPTPAGQFRQFALGGVSGLIHGWRALARVRPGFSLFQHDQLSMPGPGVSDHYVQWKYPGMPDAYAGGGDEYLLECTVNNPGWSLAEGGQLGAQWSRLTACGARGFEEVYAAGPMTLGALAPTIDLDPRVTSVSDDLCWNQRATNEAMRLGTGISFWADFSTVAVISHVVTKVAVSEQTLALVGLDKQGVEDTLSELNTDLVRLQFEINRRAIRDDQGTGSAELEGDLDTFLGFQRNSAYEDLIRSGQIPYYEHADRAQWIAQPNPPVPCARTEDCGDGRWCAFSAGTGAGTCLDLDAAVLRGFRKAETREWCIQETRADLQSTHLACRTGAGPDACAACAEAALPHLRRSCDEASYLQFNELMAAEGVSTADREAVCDTLGTDFGAFVHRPHDGTEAGALAAAAQFCSEPSFHPQDASDVVGSPIYDLDLEPPAIAEPLDEATQTLPAHHSCGATVGTRWLRYFHGAPSEAGHRHRFRVEVQDIAFRDGTRRPVAPDDLEVTLFEGPDCTGPATTATPQDRTLELPWTVPAGGGEVCVRISARRPEVWAAYDLTVVGNGPALSLGYLLEYLSYEGWGCDDYPNTKVLMQAERGYFACPDNSCIAGVQRECPALSVGEMCAFDVQSPAQWATGSMHALVTRTTDQDYRLEVDLALTPTLPPVQSPMPTSTCDGGWYPLTTSELIGAMLVTVPTEFVGRYRVDVTNVGQLESEPCGPYITEAAFIEPPCTSVPCPIQSATMGTLPIGNTSSADLDTNGIPLTVFTRLEGRGASLTAQIPVQGYQTSSHVTCEDLGNTSNVVADVHIEPL